jgi:hypothetical protein
VHWPDPSLVILAWAALAATLAAAFVGAPPGNTAAALFGVVPTRTARAPADAARRRAGCALAGVTLVTGVLVYPLLYAVVFEVVGRADFAFGAGLGAVHSLAAGFARVIRPAVFRPRNVGAFPRLVIARLVYGAVLGLLYPVPVPPH